MKIAKFNPNRLIGEDTIADFIAIGRSTVIRTELDPYRNVGAVAKKIAEDARTIFEWYLNFKGGTKACEEATRAIFDIQLGPIGCASSLREKLALLLQRDGRSFLQARSRPVLREYAAELLGRDTDRNRYRLVCELADMERDALAEAFHSIAKHRPRRVRPENGTDHGDWF